MQSPRRPEFRIRASSAFCAAARMADERHGTERHLEELGVSR